MTKLHNLYTLVVLFLAGSAMLIEAGSPIFIEAGLASKAVVRTPRQLQVHISREEIIYVLNCGKKLVPHCGRKIFASVFRRVDLNIICCRNLVYLGKRCLDTTVKGLLSMPLFHKYSARVLKTSQTVWHRCALIA